MRTFIYTKVLLLPVCTFCNKIMGLSKRKHLQQHVEHMIRPRCEHCKEAALIPEIQHVHIPCYHPHCLCPCSHA